jgi:hypothetical protein
LKKNETHKEQLLQILKEKTTATSVDEDTSFALSLVPTLRSLPEGNKLQARIEKFKFQSATGIFHQNLRENPVSVSFTTTTIPIHIPIL